MVTFFHRLLWFFLLLPVVLFIYDLVEGWVVDAQLKIRSVGQLWADIDKESLHMALDFLVPHLGQDHTKALLGLPAAFVLFVLPLMIAPIHHYLAARERKRWGSGFQH